MERDAKYATVALFALACIVAAVAFVWWYSGRGDRRDYDTYEIYFEGTVSGLSKGSPVRYLGVDVGRVTSLAVDRQDPGRVKVVADIDAMAPVSGATQAKLGFLGLTGLLYIDLQQDAKRFADAAAAKRRALPRHRCAQGQHRGVGRATAGNPRAGVGDHGAHRAPAGRRERRAISRDAREPRAGHGASCRPRSPTRRRSRPTCARSPRRRSSSRTRASRRSRRPQPDLRAALANARVASEKLAHAADGVDRLLNANDGAFGRSAGAERRRAAATGDRRAQREQRDSRARA